jgi:iron complex outermembrane recepter protein
MKKWMLMLVGMMMFHALKAQYSVSGTVKNETGEPLAGASVRILNTTIGVLSDAEGKFRIEKIPSGEFTLRISMVGFESREQTLNSGKENLEIQLKVAVNQLEEITVEATRVNEDKGIAFTNLGREDISKNNLGPDIPYLLDQTPSVVVTSDAGTGIGYTGIRIRGSDPTRTNLTINGIPLNDAESQGTFLVNLPDFASSVETIQIQRGVGTSANGAGAFGASINLSTNTFNEKAYSEISNSFGSFNTRRHTLRAGTGLIDGKYTFDMRLSSISSDGYIERAFSDLKSFYTSSAWYGKKSSLRLNVFSGKEYTYQAWGGVPFDSMATNRRHNPYVYDNETDNYTQTHYQLFFNHQISSKWISNIAFHYTRGKGYYEQYKEDREFSSIGMNDLIIGGDTITNTDWIQRRWLDNHFAGTVFSFVYDAGKKLKLVIGGAGNYYSGDHFGEIIWAEYAVVPIRHRYYDNRGEKTDVNFYVRADYTITKKFNLYVDLQERFVDYTFLGVDEYGDPLKQSVSHTFFNPKAGAVYRLSNSGSVYASFGVGNKEPNRDDYVSSTPNSRPMHETLFDYEAGYRYRSSRFNAGINAFYMDYFNQLAPNGKINDVGAVVRTNIARSFRRGIEMDGAMQIGARTIIKANLTLSQNRAVEFTEFIDNWDTWGQDTIVYRNTDLAFSPSVISGQEITFNLYKWNSNSESESLTSKKSGRMDFSFIGKYISRQMLDNTARNNASFDAATNTDLIYRSLDAYYVLDLRLSVRLNIPGAAQFDLNVMLRNVLNEMYSSNGWTYKYSYGGEYAAMTGLYPQAGRNILAGLTVRF